MKKQTLIAGIAVMLGLASRSITVCATETIFADEGSTSSWNWADSSIYWAYNEGIIAGKTGKEGNVFDAEGRITRAEAAAMLVRWKGIDPEQYNDNYEVFTDVEPEEWYAKFVNAAYENELIAGKGNRSFDPNGYLTRAEAAALLVTAEGWIVDASDSGFTDVPEAWHTKYINTAYAHGVVAGKGNGIFKPVDAVTRAEFVVMLDAVWPMEEAADTYYEYVYDENGRIAEMLTYYSEGSPSYINIYEYDDNGLLIQMEEQDGEGALEYVTQYTYDEQGRLLSEQEENAEGEVYGREEYTYDSEGKLQSQKSISHSGRYWMDNFDAEGKRISRVIYDKDGDLEYRIEYSYSENGLETTATEIRGITSTVMWKTQEIHDETGELIELWTYHYSTEGTKIWHERYTYDDAGNMIQEAQYNSYGVMDSWWNTYEYDEFGRCTKRTSYSYFVFEE